MHADATIDSVLRGLPLLRFDSTVTRFINEAYRGTPLETIGARLLGGRYNPPGTPALYTSLRRATALAEATQFVDDEDPIRPMLMLSVRISSGKIADLTQASTLKKLGTTRAELTALIVDKRGGTAPTQTLGRVAHATASIDGLLVWSRVADRQKNLVIFPDRLNMGYALYDPGHDLPALHPAIVEAMNTLMQLD